MCRDKSLGGSTNFHQDQKKSRLVIITNVKVVLLTVFFDTLTVIHRGFLGEPNLTDGAVQTCSNNSEKVRGGKDPRCGKKTHG